MKKVLFGSMLIIALLTLASCGSGGGSDSSTVAPTTSTMQLSQFGITWTFDKTYTYGQFANGDYWVVGPVTIIGIDPSSTEVNGRTMNGSMLNPSPPLISDGNNQGYDSAIYALGYDPSLNVALNVSSSNPLTLQNNSSLVSTISEVVVQTGPSTPQIETAAVLTVLAGAPASGSFRPYYSAKYGGGNKPIHNISEFASQQSLLLQLAPVANTPALASVERNFERVWIDHNRVWGSRYEHPVDDMIDCDYGRDLSQVISDGALMLHLNFTWEQKQTLLIRYIQLGIDLYGIAQYKNETGGNITWEADGGHAGGRKWPILFAGIMLNDADMKAIGQKSGDHLYSGSYGPGNPPPDYIHFGEDDQTFYVTQADVDITDHYYPPDKVTYINYATPDIGMPEWGIRHADFPSYDGNEWDADYRPVVNPAFSGVVQAARMMDASAQAKTLWNHNALFDYYDRAMAAGAAAGTNPTWRTSVTYYLWGTTTVNSIWATNPDSRDRNTWSFSGTMWDAYRNLY